MELETQFKLNKSQEYITFLRYNSKWYKILMRDPSKINDFFKEYNEYTRYKKQEKLKKALEYIEFFQSFVSEM